MPSRPGRAPVSPRHLRVLFAFENELPSRQADAEVFTTTARYLAGHVAQARMHLPAASRAAASAAAALTGMAVVRAWAPVRPAALRHLLCGLTIVLRREFRHADLVYTRNLWVARMSILAGQRVVFDHYRPWGDQIPPLRRWIYRLFCRERFLAVICHSDYTRRAYLALGVPEDRLHCIRNGFEPERLPEPMELAAAKQRIEVPARRRTVVYTGRLNHKKGLELVVEAARLLPEVLFILVGSTGHGSIEALAADVANVRIVPWQPDDRLAWFMNAADILLIPPSRHPLATYGSTVLPLKLYLYMASGRPILAGDTPDIREVLTHGRNAVLCEPDRPAALAAAVEALLADEALGGRLAARAGEESLGLTWEARAGRIAALMAERMQAAPVSGGSWSGRQTRSWLLQSWRWLLHLVRRRSWVLPPTAT
ncbi:glycosyltransferase [Lichenicoccus roseus]|uniref:Glycosyltransferase family 4 protein n=1 Tax=Lichenicoccus roseus TaxID=2683649 RepID=A0A5R9J4E6_9PROT|nr:glycosyltransferase [Lichenicoccus roseus]TLU71743.1 glycosyltransferase family 4 protein [Lichenicoccus roseus]